jgi:hypothetical protein
MTAKPSKRLVVLLVVLLKIIIITITAIKNNITEVHDGIYRVVISSRPSAPQLSQHIPPCMQYNCCVA